MAKEPYLNCPFCPAQSFPKRTISEKGFRYAAIRYECHGGHSFYIRLEKETDGIAYIASRVPEQSE